MCFYRCLHRSTEYLYFNGILYAWQFKGLITILLDLIDIENWHFLLKVQLFFPHQQFFLFDEQDVLENDDVKLDNMFIASMIADIIRGMIYLHESPLKYHGSLCTSNCLIDSRWVVKLCDFGLHAFKMGAEDSPNLQTMAAKCQSMYWK